MLACELAAVSKLETLKSVGRGATGAGRRPLPVGLEAAEAVWEDWGTLAEATAALVAEGPNGECLLSAAVGAGYAMPGPADSAGLQPGPNTVVLAAEVASSSSCSLALARAGLPGTRGAAGSAVVRGLFAAGGSWSTAPASLLSLEPARTYGASSVLLSPASWCC